ncbi:MAG: lytic transglycosylase domain-containing protein [bacterium]
MKNKKHIMLASVGIGCMLAAMLVEYLNEGKQLAFKADIMQNETKLLTSIAKIDRIRKDNIAKALSVIDRFNPEMPAELKHNIAREISDAAMKYENLDVDLICATITHESAFTWNPQVVSPAGALGLMQVMPGTGEFLARIADVDWTSPEEVLFDPVLNIRLGSRYLSSLIEMYAIDGGLAAYNGGGKRAEMWLALNRANGILYEETQNYVPAVLSLYESFKQVN